MTDSDHFGVYYVYPRKPLRDPSQTSDPNALYDDLSGSHSNIPNQGPLHSNVQNLLYYHPFSNPSAAAMMALHHLGGPTLSCQQIICIAHTLGDLYSDLSDQDLRNFSATVETRRLDACIASTLENVFQHEDGWLESSVQI